MHVNESKYEVKLTVFCNFNHSKLCELFLLLFSSEVIAGIDVCLHKYVPELLLDAIYFRPIYNL
jgi:hypothetical protein